MFQLRIRVEQFRYFCRELLVLLPVSLALHLDLSVDVDQFAYLFQGLLVAVVVECLALVWDALGAEVHCGGWKVKLWKNEVLFEVKRLSKYSKWW